MRSGKQKKRRRKTVWTRPSWRNGSGGSASSLDSPRRLFAKKCGGGTTHLNTVFFFSLFCWEMIDFWVFLLFFASGCCFVCLCVWVSYVFWFVIVKCYLCYETGVVRVCSPSCWIDFGFLLDFYCVLQALKFEKVWFGGGCLCSLHGFCCIIFWLLWLHECWSFPALLVIGLSELYVEVRIKLYTCCKLMNDGENIGGVSLCWVKNGRGTWRVMGGKEIFHAELNVKNNTCYSRNVFLVFIIFYAIVDSLIVAFVLICHAYEVLCFPGGDPWDYIEFIPCWIDCE